MVNVDARKRVMKGMSERDVVLFLLSSESGNYTGDGFYCVIRIQVYFTD